ncbi:MAG: hypothetical protein RPU64_09900 [Candidatus Sedimenticola sp. (ex Thyasira tokunagai)]
MEGQLMVNQVAIMVGLTLTLSNSWAGSVPVFGQESDNLLTIEPTVKEQGKSTLPYYSPQKFDFEPLRNLESNSQEGDIDLLLNNQDQEIKEAIEAQ